MKKYLWIFVICVLGITILFGCTGTYVDSGGEADTLSTRAMPNPLPAETEHGTQVIIPAHAIQLAHGVFDLGTAVHEGRVVHGYAFVDYRKNYGHKDTHNPGGGGPGGPGDPPAESTCFAFLANGAKWKTVEPYGVNPSNAAGLSESFVTANILANIQKWEDASSTDILGDEDSSIVVDGIDLISPDGKNEVLFGNIDNAGAIAVTVVWGIFRGKPSNRELVEWDQLYDDVDFEWSSTGEAGKMDFENIAAHEIGHSVGMGHPSDTCTEETMYRFASEGETLKRDLNDGDIAGINDLY